MTVAVTESCTKGFMSSDLLTIKAQQISNSIGSATTIAESQPTRWIFGLNYRLRYSSCSLSGVLLGVDIRQVTDSRNEYPSIEIWSRSTTHDDGDWITTYSRQQQSFNITLTPANFTTTGMYSITFPSPVSISRSTYIGINQPANDNSVVRIYKENGTIDVIRIKDDYFSDDDIEYQFNGRQDFTLVDYSVFFHPITG